MTFNLLTFDINRHSTSWVSILEVNDWALFYWEKEPKHARGKMTFLTLFGIRVISK